MHCTSTMREERLYVLSNHGMACYVIQCQFFPHRNGEDEMAFLIEDPIRYYVIDELV